MIFATKQDIIKSGAQEIQLPEEYQRYLDNILIYRPPDSGRRRAGAAVFLAMWGPVMRLMEMITKATIRRDGYAPTFVVWLVRFTVVVIWFTHDVFFAPVCGRGDGLDDDQGRDWVGDEKGSLRPLLERKVERIPYFS